MVTRKIYALAPSNTHVVIESLDPSYYDSKRIPFNSCSLLSAWTSPEFVFSKSDRHTISMPDIAMPIGGGFAIRADLRNALFAKQQDFLEFLPVKISGQNWLFVNVLYFESNYDADESLFYRAENGQIFMIIRLVLRGVDSASPEIFVIGDSNRASIFAHQCFVDRCQKLGLKGVVFREIGEVRA